MPDETQQTEQMPTDAQAPDAQSQVVDPAPAAPEPSGDRPFGMSHDELRDLQEAQANHARGILIADLVRREPLVRELVEELDATKAKLADALSKKGKK